MEVTIVGCSGSFAGPDSPASCYLLRAEFEGRTWSIVLDLGNGALGNLQRHVDPLTVDAVLISHLHVDHFIDLCGLYVMLKYVPGGSGREDVPTYGPEGLGEHLAHA
ncbi:MAG TPA: MBL fold metallo-hydrolase, partial [Intrasporangium sp.]|nr:MBL fold metallo-hydrolase [Intrasporangium sp.]